MSLQTRLAALIAAIGADIKSLAAGKADASKGVTNGDAHDHSGGDGAQIAYSSLSGRPTLGTAAPLNVAASGNAAAGEVVKGNDTRLSDSREWSESTVGQAEAEAGTATTRRAWTAQRVRQAIAAWWDSVKSSLTGPVGITDNSSSPALTVTQTGAGNAIVANGRVGIGAAANPYHCFQISGTAPGSGGYSLSSGITHNYDTTTASSGGYAFHTSLITSGAGEIASLRHFNAQQGTLSGAVTTQHGFAANNSLIGAVNNYGFYGNIPSGVGRWNFYAAGAAANYFAGDVTANAGFNQTPTRSTVASGSTITLTTGTNHLLYDQAATVAALTVTLPSANLTNGQIINICTRSDITALTINGGTIYGAPTTLAAGGFCSFIYSSAASAWFRRG